MIIFSRKAKEMQTENWNDHDFVLSRITQDGADLRFASRKLRGQKDLVVIAFAQWKCSAEGTMQLWIDAEKRENTLEKVKAWASLSLAAYLRDALFCCSDRILSKA